jgi:undecaprenyl-diphosphatase
LRSGLPRGYGSIASVAWTDWDLRLLHAVYGGMHGPWAPAMVALTVAGSGWSSAALLPFIRWGRSRRWAICLTVAIVTQATTVWLLKRIVGRVRPWLAFGLPPPIGMPRDGSFPSGHAAGSFCVAAFIAVVVPSLQADARWRGRAIGALAVVLAGFIGFSRVYLGAHFPSDVTAGALLGGATGAMAGRFYRSGARFYGSRFRAVAAVDRGPRS